MRLWLAAFLSLCFAAAQTAGLPDPLRMADGSPVTSAAEWHARRRPELLDLFAREMYGQMPPRPANIKFREFDRAPDALDGKAIRKQVTIFLNGKPDGPKMDLLIYIPKAARHPVPAILGINFWGNHAVASDPGIRITGRWVESNKNPYVDLSCVKNGHATQECRGINARQWPLDEILSRGYALVTFYRGDIDPDTKDGFAQSIRAYYPELQNRGDNFSTIGAWAWALSRAMDYLETDRDIDSKRVTVFGWSRLGKAALWAGATDERFAAVISNESGAGGAKLFRRGAGEDITRLNTVFPHWYCRNFRKYDGRDASLPFDQHEVIALIAPRPVYIASAIDDHGSDPEGEFLAAKAAEPVYRLFGKQGIPADKWPAVNHPVAGQIGYHVRSGGHDVMPFDWAQYLRFLDSFPGAGECSATFEHGELTIANSHVQRKWRVSNGLLYATSFRDLDSGFEWLARPSTQPAPYPPHKLGDDRRDVTFTTETGKATPVEAESLVAVLRTTGPAQLTYRFQIFPAARGVSVQLTTSAGTAAAPGSQPASGADPSGIEKGSPASVADAKVVEDAIENLDLAPSNLKLTQVRLLDQTDSHNELVFEDEWLLHTSERVQLPGNLFIVEDPLTGRGLIFLKEAPLPHARPVKNPADFAYEPGTRRFHLLGHGIPPEGGQGYRSITLAYSGGRAGRIEALQTYQRQLRLYDPKRDAMLLSNTWGDRSRDARINSEFLTREVLAGARLGVDVIQIDDGWQRGKTSNSARGGGVWNGFWAADPHFWDVDPARFPNGLSPVVQLAAGKGMKFGLWFAPDSSNDFANWEKDAARLLEIHRTLGVDYFKIDGVKAVSKAGERNLRALFDRVLEATGGGVTFDLDVTAETRPGYFGMINAGPIFVENRYTDWHRYWPHQTLRNLWKLAQYVDPLRLRMEFLNNARNTQNYAGDPLAPAAYSPDYLFATTMFANPLGWFETSNLPPSYFEQLPPLIARWKQERAALFSGTIIPVGQAPDGAVWTGFVSVSADRRSGYALIFREANREADWQCELPLFDQGRFHVTALGGRGSASFESGRLHVQIPQAMQFLWVKVQREG